MNCTLFIFNHYTSMCIISYVQGTGKLNKLNVFNLVILCENLVKT